MERRWQGRHRAATAHMIGRPDCGREGRTLLILLALVMAAGCSGNLRPLPPLPDLQLPGVTQIPGITTLHAAPQSGYIRAVATYMSPGQSAAQILFTLDSELYTVGLDGSDLHT